MFLRVASYGNLLFWEEKLYKLEIVRSGTAGFQGLTHVVREKNVRKNPECIAKATTKFHDDVSRRGTWNVIGLGAYSNFD